MATPSLSYLFALYAISPKGKKYPLANIFAKFEDHEVIKNLYGKCFSILEKQSDAPPGFPIEMVRYAESFKKTHLPSDVVPLIKEKFKGYKKYPTSVTIRSWFRGKTLGLKTFGPTPLSKYFGEKGYTTSIASIHKHLAGSQRPSLLHLYLALELSDYDVNELDKQEIQLYFGIMSKPLLSKIIGVLIDSSIPLTSADVTKKLSMAGQRDFKENCHRLARLAKNRFIIRTPGKKKGTYVYSMPDIHPDRKLSTLKELANELNKAKIPKSLEYNIGALARKISKKLDSELDEELIASLIRKRCVSYIQSLPVRAKPKIREWKYRVLAGITEHLSYSCNTRAELITAVREEFQADDSFAEKLLKTLKEYGCADRIIFISRL